MKLWAKFCTLSRARQIALGVFLLHFGGIFILSMDHLIHGEKPQKNRISVHTVRPKPPTLRTAQSPSLAKPASHRQTIPARAPSKTATAAPKKSDAKQVQTKSPVVKSEISESDEALLREIAENLEILSSESNQPRSHFSLSIPSALPRAVRIEESDESDPTYGEALIAYLQESLDLPEYGEVRARLEIDSNGQLTHCEIIESRNTKNGEFLKKRLPELTFPCSNDLGNDPLTFTITFKNVETAR